MNTENRSFPAKIMLFGEYSLMQGSAAITVPFDRFGARLSFSGNPDKQFSGRHLREFYSFLEEGLPGVREFKKIIDLKRFNDDLQKGIYLDSDIPAGQGLGSSGALVAAVWSEYAFEPGDIRPGTFTERITMLREVLSDMEAFFHGSSSGIDPLTSYAGYPVVYSAEKPLQEGLANGFSTYGQNGCIFLMQSGLKRKTSHLIQLYKGKLENETFRQELQGRYIPLCNDCIKALQLSSSNLEELFRSLSELQFELFPEMIPDVMKPSWQSGLDKGTYSLKLCGAGGGGFFLGYSSDPEIISGNAAINGMQIQLIKKSF